MGSLFQKVKIVSVATSDINADFVKVEGEPLQTPTNGYLRSVNGGGFEFVPDWRYQSTLILNLKGCAVRCVAVPV